MAAANRQIRRLRPVKHQPLETPHRNKAAHRLLLSIGDPVHNHIHLHYRHTNKIRIVPRSGI